MLNVDEKLCTRSPYKRSFGTLSTILYFLFQSEIFFKIIQRLEAFFSIVTIVNTENLVSPWWIMKVNLNEFSVQSYIN